MAEKNLPVASKDTTNGSNEAPQNVIYTEPYTAAARPSVYAESETVQIELIQNESQSQPLPRFLGSLRF